MSRRRNSALAAIELLLGARPDMNLTLCRIFFYVAENPGLNIVELAILCGFSEATASRGVGALLVGDALLRTDPSSRDGRSVAVRLAVGGERLAREIDRRIAAMVTIDQDYPREIGGPPDRVRHAEAPAAGA